MVCLICLILVRRKVTCLPSDLLLRVSQKPLQRLRGQGSEPVSGAEMWITSFIPFCISIIVNNANLNIILSLD